MNINRAPILMIQWGPANELDELGSIEDRFAELAPEILHSQAYYEAVTNEAFREFLVRKAVGYSGDHLQDWFRAEDAVRPRFKSHDIASVRFTNSDAVAFEEQLRAIVSIWSNAQTLYFSCHGTPATLAYDRSATVTLSFQALEHRSS